MMKLISIAVLLINTAIANTQEDQDLAALYANQTCEERQYYQEIYPVCDDATQLESDAYATAEKEGKTVLFVFGSAYCGWCQNLHLLFSTDKKAEFAAACPEVNDFIITEVPVGYYVVGLNEEGKEDWLYEKHNGKELAQKMWDTAGSDPGGIPALAVLNPNDKSKVIAIETGSLEDNSNNQRGHDYTKLCNALKDAKASLNK